MVLVFRCFCGRRDAGTVLRRQPQLIGIQEHPGFRAVAEIRVPERERCRPDAGKVIGIRFIPSAHSLHRTTGATRTDASKAVRRTVDEREVAVVVTQVFEDFQTPFVRLTVAALVIGSCDDHCRTVDVCPGLIVNLSSGALRADHQERTRSVICHRDSWSGRRHAQRYTSDHGCGVGAERMSTDANVISLDARMLPWDLIFNDVE